MKKTDFLVGVVFGGILFGLSSRVSKSKKFEQNREAIKAEAEKLYKAGLKEVEQTTENSEVTSEELVKEKSEQEIIDEKILEIKTKVLNSRARN